MTLLDEMRAEATLKGPACSVRLLLDGMAPDERADLLSAFADPSILTSVIARVLHKRGYTIGQETLQRHRRGSCRCRSLTT